MNNVKEMPYGERYARVMDNMKFDEAFILPFVREHLGDQAAAELKEDWQKTIESIPDAASDKEKYEIAYTNWIGLAKAIYPYIRNRMGEEGLKKFERAEIEGLRKKNAGPALLMLKIIGAFSPAAAFGMTSKQMAYQFQWLTPYSVPELTSKKVVLEIPRCKILDFPDTEDICIVGCQSTYPQWVAEQFKVNMKFDRKGHSCTGTLSPLEK